MTRRQRKELFSLRAHELAVRHLRDDPSRTREALGVIEHWRQVAGGDSHCEPYWREWERLLAEGVEAIERTVCVPTDHAATLRSTSPLGRFISAADRNRLLRESMAAP